MKTRELEETLWELWEDNKNSPKEMLEAFRRYQQYIEDNRYSEKTRMHWDAALDCKMDHNYGSMKRALMLLCESLNLRADYEDILDEYIDLIELRQHEGINESAKEEKLRNYILKQMQ